MRIKLTGVFITIAIASVLMAQETEPGGIWTSISLEKEITKKWSVNGEFEFRTHGINLLRDRFTAQLGTDYEIFNNLNQFMRINGVTIDTEIAEISASRSAASRPIRSLNRPHGSIPTARPSVVAPIASELVLALMLKSRAISGNNPCGA